MRDAQVLIVGAGPTGLVLALWLARAQVPFRVIDKKGAPGGGSRAMAVQARTLEFYRQLGLVDAVLAAGFRMDRLHLRSPGGEIATIPFDRVGRGESPYPFVLSLPQDEHELLLTRQLAAAGHAVDWDTELVGLDQDATGVRATLRKNGVELTWAGTYLCGCDGARSAVRQQLGVGFPGGTYDQLFYVCDAEAVGPWSPNDFTGYLAEKTFCLCFPVRTPGQFRFIGLVPAALREKDDATFDELRAGVEQVTGTRVTRVHWFSTYRVHHRVADRFRVGRLFLAGDAGHIHSPAGGQGMNTGIGDAVNLAWKLAAVLKRQAADAILDTYQAERLPFARSLVATTDRVFDAVVGRSVVARLVRTVFAPYVMPFILGFSAVRRAQFRLVSQTRIAYHESPLSDGSAGGVDAGDRLPWVEGADNFAPLASLDWQVHVYGTATAELGAFAADVGLVVHEWPWTDAAERAGLERDALYLVRPDGYVGFAGRSPEGLRAYLERFALRSHRERQRPWRKLRAMN